MTKEKFIEKAKKVHGNKYDYSLVDYKNNKTKVKIICPEHGIFEKEASNHLKGGGCNKCNLEEKRIKEKEKFMKKAKEIHGNKYDYSLVEYKNNKIKVKIICPIHGEFYQRPNDHLMRHGCSECRDDNNKKLFAYSTEKFIEKAKKIQIEKYDYSLVEYVNNRTPVKIICPIHGVFEQNPHEHFRGHGCPKCFFSSKKEDRIEKYLQCHNIFYEKEKIFKECKDIFPLPFDFYLPEYNILIEYDGEQHFKPIEFFGGEEKFKKQQLHDEIKNVFAKENKIKLVRIPYWEDEIKSLDKKIKI